MIGMPIPCPDEMVKISAEQRIDFAIHNEDGGYFRVMRNGDVVELSKDEWDELFNGEEWNVQK